VDGRCQIKRGTHPLDRAVLFPGEECLACNWTAVDADFNETTTGSLEIGEANAPSAAWLDLLRVPEPRSVVRARNKASRAKHATLISQQKAAEKAAKPQLRAAKKAEKARREEEKWETIKEVDAVRPPSPEPVDPNCI